MSLRMAMSMTPELAHENADDRQTVFDVNAEGISSRSNVRASSVMSEREFGQTNASPARIDAALAEMRDFLSIMHPTTDAEALHSLRIAFPGVPLTERITAIKTRFFA